MTEQSKGRPSSYSTEISNEICFRAMTRTLYKITQDDDMPNRDTIYRWLNENKDFSDNYARACKIRREERFEKMEEIPDIEDDVQRARLKVDVLKWQLAKEEPRKYGDKIDMTTNGKDLPTPILSGMSRTNINDDIIE